MRIIYAIVSNFIGICLTLDMVQCNVIKMIMPQWVEPWRVGLCVCGCVCVYVCVCVYQSKEL